MVQYMVLGFSVGELVYHQWRFSCSRLRLVTVSVVKHIVVTVKEHVM
jgi:hypothetical protein